MFEAKTINFVDSKLKAIYEEEAKEQSKSSNLLQVPSSDTTVGN